MAQRSHKLVWIVFFCISIVARANNPDIIPMCGAVAAARAGSLLIGSSPQMERLRNQVARAALVPTTVLITGESGTGKEVVAQELHRLSPRSQKPLRSVNCAAIPDSLLQSELFGHEKGAFTGATGVRKGMFELADGGSIFLDEIGDMAALTQAAMLRVLETREFSRMGGSVSLRSDFRLISATNANFSERIAAKTFREDLFWRISVIRIETPPLRTHLSDIPELVEHLLPGVAAEVGLPLRRPNPELLQAMMEYHWPGNVRELRNFLIRSVALSDGPELALENLTAHQALTPGAPATVLRDDAPLPKVDDVLHDLFVASLRRSNGTTSEAARLLGLNRVEFVRKAKKLGIALP